MLEQSVIHKSGQCWKLDVAVVVMLTGSIAPLFPDGGISWLEGTVLAVLGYLFALISIRWARCGNRWFWPAIMNASLYTKIFRGSSCLRCGHDFDSD
jgi:hypothetical protein